MLIDLVNKYRDTLVNSSDYIVCYGLLDKINEEMLIQTSDSENLFANAKQIKTLNDTKTNIQNTINNIHCFRI